MNISNVTDIIDDYNNTLTSNCTDNDNNIEIVIPLITIIPCGLSLVCLISFMMYTLIKPLFNKKKYSSTYTYLSNINGEDSLSNSSS